MTVYGAASPSLGTYPAGAEPYIRVWGSTATFDLTGYNDGFAAGVASVIPDAVAPTITIVSPTPGVAPGGVGGFSADYAIAKNTPIVLQVTDLTPGVRYVSVVATFTFPDGSVTIEPVFHRGAFVGNYAALSTQIALAHGIELHCQRTGGWPGATAIVPMQFDIDALDAAGNLA